MAVDYRPHGYRKIWEQKPILNALYHSYYQQILARCNAGKTLEIGGGSGNLKSFAPSVVSTDILFAPWLDVVSDAQLLPFALASFDNIVLFDVLHHIAEPRLFLAEAVRILRARGRIILLEPGITPVSWLFYRLFHPEPIRMRIDPLAPGSLKSGDDPFDANQAIPTLLLTRYRSQLHCQFPELHVVEFRRIALFSYPLSGGFRPWSLIPTSLVDPLLRLERLLEPLLGPLLAFRLLAVIERRDTNL
jgi:SAM-dependent methyltransferase